MHRYLRNRNGFRLLLGLDREGEEPSLPTLSILTDFSVPNL
ncbi:hypothetical protein THTE_3328 [Thermogutta terrifontis]|uniref:Uncharacterized protein n=1 Tax=Thermogutta terrifontis TaxID=1331910 RepID=A0A286RIY5_9BACT|nr:hypothetical protein THTE_3328 [Thermogutta terrifontis]